MLPIIRKEIFNRRTSLIMYSLGAAAMLLIYIIAFPALRTQAKEYAQLVKNIPQAYLKAFGANDIGLDNMQSFLAGKQFNFVWPLLAALLFISQAGNAIAGDIERGTAGSLLSQPVSRTRIFLSKYVGGLFTIVVFTLMSIPITVPLARLWHVNTDGLAYWYLTVLALGFGLAIYSFTMLISAVSSERSRVYGIVAGLLLAMYVANVLASIETSYDKLKYLSIFHYFDVNQALIHRQINVISMLVFLGITVISTLIGISIFNKRDINI